MDIKDSKILYYLDENARQPISALAKKVRLSKQSAAYRVKKLTAEDKVVEKFLTLLNVSKLGYTNYKVFLRTQNVSEDDEAKMVKHITAHPHVMWFASCDGAWDMVFNILAQSPEELYQMLNMQLKCKSSEF